MTGGRSAAATRTVARLRAAGCVFAEDEAAVLTSAAAGAGDLEAMVARRVAGEPLEHVVGWAEFCGLRIGVDPGVFVPRRRTVLLVHETVALLTARSPTTPGGRAGRPVVVDLCCGSGAVGAAVLAAVPEVELHAADVDAAAVRCARRNLAAAGARVYQGNLFAALPTALSRRVDVLVANVPYVPTDAICGMPSEARDHEPAAALDGGADGLAMQRRVIGSAPAWLAPGGHLLVETSRRQVAATVDAFARSGLSPRVVTSDEPDGVVVVGRATGVAAVSEP